MKKYVVICATLVALAWVGVAAAAAPQGKLTGSALRGSPLHGTFTITSPVIDGGMTFVGLENDQSGNCDGDSGIVTITGNTPFNFRVVCAHYVASSGCCNAGSPKMRFAFQVNSAEFVVVRVTDNGDSPDTFGAATVTASSLAQAQAMVNTGVKGGGGGSWIFASLTGNYTITAAQT